MDLAPPSALRWFSIAVQSIPAYLGSVMAPDSALVRTEALAITRIINIPHQAIPIYTLATLNDINIPNKINTIWYQSLAARCRVYMKSALMPRLLDDIRAQRAREDAFYIYPHEDWFNNSCLHSIETAYNTIHALHPNLHFGLANNLQREITQWNWADYVPRHAQHATMYTTLSRRLAKNGIHMSAAHTRHSMTTTREAMGQVPAFVQFVFLKFVCNAWTTTGRFRRDIAPCRWCGVSWGDDLGHYAACTVMLSELAARHPALHDVWAEYSHPPLLPRVSPGAYGLDLPSREVAVDLLLWIDFLAFLYSSGQELISSAGWSAAWVARARVRNRYG
jgi:hypothetical protein